MANKTNAQQSKKFREKRFKQSLEKLKRTIQDPVFLEEIEMLEKKYLPKFYNNPGSKIKLAKNRPLAIEQINKMTQDEFLKRWPDIMKFYAESENTQEFRNWHYKRLGVKVSTEWGKLCDKWDLNILALLEGLPVAFVIRAVGRPQKAGVIMKIPISKIISGKMLKDCVPIFIKDMKDYFRGKAIDNAPVFRDVKVVGAPQLPYVSKRNQRIQKQFKSLRKKMTVEKAIEILAKKFPVSSGRIKDIVYPSKKIATKSKWSPGQKIDLKKLYDVLNQPS